MLVMKLFYFFVGGELNSLICRSFNLAIMLQTFSLPCGMLLSFQKKTNKQAYGLEGRASNMVEV